MQLTPPVGALHTVLAADHSKQLTHDAGSLLGGRRLDSIGGIVEPEQMTFVGVHG